MIQTKENGQNVHFGPDLGPLGPSSSCQFFPPKIWLCQSIDIMVSYHHVPYQKKLMTQSWENLVTDEWTDRQIDESDFLIKLISNLSILWMLKLLPLLNNFKWLKLLKKGFIDFIAWFHIFQHTLWKPIAVSRANFRLKSIWETKLTFLRLLNLSCLLNFTESLASNSGYLLKWGMS